MDPTRLSLVQQARAVRDGEISAGALVDAHLTRIAAHDAALGAFLRVDREGAQHAARAVDAARVRGEALGPLAGVPLAVKDQIVTRGLETTAGSQILKGWVPPYDATAVARLRAAGAVIIGKTNQDEFAMGSSTENSSFHVTRNPWDTTRVPGGSSGGSAAAVAAGLAAGALGTDTGGSIRQPASFCGIVGVKPTYGRVSRYGAIAFASSLDQIGPLARSVADAALLLKVIAGQDDHDQTSLPLPAPDVSALAAGHVDLGGLRIGMPAEYLGEGVADDVRSGVRAALAKLEGEGATLVPVSLPHTRYAVATYYLIATAEASSNLARFDGLRYGHRTASYADLGELYARSRDEGFGREVKRRIMLGTFALSSGYYDAYYLHAQKVRTLIRRDFDSAFAQCDLIAGPTSPLTAFSLGERVADPLAMYLMDIFTIPASLAGLPGVSLPVGVDGRGLPIGLQLLGPPLQELRLLQVAHALEAMSPPWPCPFGGEVSA